jgi:hypothetical protein
MNETLQKLTEAAKTAPKAHLGAVTPMVEKHVDEILGGKWSVDDVLETQVDEISMATNAGSGTDRAVGYSREKDQWERMIRSYEEYLVKTRTEASRSSAKRFLKESAPEAREELIQKFIERLKEKGFKL